MQIKKYGNKKTFYNGKVYDSKKEAKRAYELDMLRRAGVISNLERQRRFELQASCTIRGITVRAITYVADFYYYDNEKHTWVAEDTKGFKTEVYKIKKKLFLVKYPDILFIES